MIREPTCPHCAHPINLLPLWRRAKTDRLGLLEEPTGVQCSSCRAQLEVVGRRSIPTVAAAWILAAGWALLIVTIVGPGMWAAVGGIPPLLWLLFGGGEWVAAKWATLEPVQNGKRLTYPLDVLWACQRCNYENPSAKDLCWNCGKPRVP